MNKPTKLNERQMEARRLVSEARQRFAMGRPEEAESMLQRALALNPSELQAAAALGAVAAETGRRDLARRRMAEVLQKDPNYLPALCWMAILTLEIDQISTAKQYAQRALAVEPKNAAMLTTLARCATLDSQHGEAIRLFEKSLELNPNDPSVLYDYADALIVLGQEREAVTVLRKALLLAPTPRGQLRLAYLELGLGMIDEAEKLCSLALGKDPSEASAHALMARILTEQLRLDEAEDHWAQASELNSTPGAFNLQHALSLNAIGHFEAAMVELNRSIEAKPVQGAAYQALVFNKRIDESDMPLIRQMEGLMAHEAMADNERMALLYSLGKSFDNLGDYERAIGYFDQANGLKAKAVGLKPFDRAAFRSYIDSKIKMFSKEFFARSVGLGVESSLPLMIVGMMRSGTTLAEQMLSCHLLVGGAGEQHYWGDHEISIMDYSSGSVNAARLRSCADEFVQLLSSIAPGFPHVIDKNPANIQVVGSLHLAFPNARIIHTRRNAIDTALSMWMTPMSTNAPFMHDRSNIVFAYKQYLRLMDHWREVIPADRFLEVRYEVLAGHPEIYAPKMVEFCGLEWDEACLHPELNQKRIKTPSMWQARQPVYTSSTDRWKKYEPWLGPFADLEGLA